MKSLVLKKNALSKKSERRPPVRTKKKSHSKGGEAVLQGRKIGPRSVKRFQKSPSGPKVTGPFGTYYPGGAKPLGPVYVWVFLCPDGTTLQHPVAPTRRRRRRWLKLTRNVLAFAFKVVF